MTVFEAVEKCGFEVLTNGNNLENQIEGCYIGDLLSWVMGNAEEKNAWLTIMSNINIVAVASLTGVSCIILCEGVSPDEGVVEKANSQNVVILKSEKSAYYTALELNGALK